MNNTPELLSPAGDLDKMRFGIAYGADAVYMAGTRFGMRAAATNFDDNALREGIAYAHAHGVKCYITVNIMPSNRDLPALPAYLELLQDAGADALIIADVGVLRMARRYAPKVPVHISTQTSILNHEAANYWADEGAERIVLARELSLEEIAEIRAKTPKELEIEAFVHGAMCISYSGRCLVSQIQNPKCRFCACTSGLFVLFLMLRPIKRPSNRLIQPESSLRRLFSSIEGAYSVSHRQSYFSSSRSVPHTLGRESGKMACAERGRFTDDRTADGAVRNILWNCIRKAVAAGTASTKGGKGTIALHGGQAGRSPDRRWTPVRRG